MAKLPAMAYFAKSKKLAAHWHERLNPSIEMTRSGRLRQPELASHVKRFAA